MAEIEVTDPRELLDNPDFLAELTEVCQSVILAKVVGLEMLPTTVGSGNTREDGKVSANVPESVKASLDDLFQEVWATLAEVDGDDELAQILTDGKKLTLWVQKILNRQIRARRSANVPLETMGDRTDESLKIGQWWNLGDNELIALASHFCSSANLMGKSVMTTRKVYYSADGRELTRHPELPVLVREDEAGNLLMVDPNGQPWRVARTETKVTYHFERDEELTPDKKQELTRLAAAVLASHTLPNDRKIVDMLTKRYATVTTVENPPSPSTIAKRYKALGKKHSRNYRQILAKLAQTDKKTIADEKAEWAEAFLQSIPVKQRATVEVPEQVQNEQKATTWPCRLKDGRVGRRRSISWNMGYQYLPVNGRRIRRHDPSVAVSENENFSLSSAERVVLRKIRQDALSSAFGTNWHIDCSSVKTDEFCTLPVPAEAAIKAMLDAVPENVMWVQLMPFVRDWDLQSNGRKVLQVEKIDSEETYLRDGFGRNVQDKDAKTDMRSRGALNWTEAYKALGVPEGEEPTESGRVMFSRDIKAQARQLLAEASRLENTAVPSLFGRMRKMLPDNGKSVTSAEMQELVDSFVLWQSRKFYEMYSKEANK